MNKSSVFFSLAFAGMVTLSPRAEACTCAPPPPVKQALKDAAAVFTGKVLDIRDVSSANPFGTREVVLEVGESWKGRPSGKSVKVYTSRSGASCGFQFYRGEEYLIYAYPFQNEELSTNLCTRTKDLDEAQEDLQELGPGNGD